jgi:hypothetical protein
MSHIRLAAIFVISGICGLHGFTQDFILQGCYWDCPAEASAEIDPASFNFWVEKMEKQAPSLGHAGFSYVWLPAFYTGQEKRVVQLVNALRTSGMEAITDIAFYQTAGTIDSLRFPVQQIQWMWDYLNIRGFRLIADQAIQPEALAQVLQSLVENQQLPKLFSVRTPHNNVPAPLADFVNRVEGQLPEEIVNTVDTRVFDYALREALRQACSNPEYDVRQVFSSGIRDVTALSGFKIVTFVNSPEFYNPNGIEGDADDLIHSPLLAYAYLLTNNQVGLPAVFYGDYFGPESEIEYFLDRDPLRKEIDQLIQSHREFIYNSTSVEYLNRPDSDRSSHYLSVEEGAGPDRALLFQLDGNNTPAGQAAGGGKDVIVGINFADTTLRVIQEINMSNIQPGDRFTDILGRSNQPETMVGQDNEHDIPNAVYLELPARSYSIWVQGKAEKVYPSPITFSADRIGDYVELSWEIPDEEFIQGYQVERSVNSKKFEALAWVNAIGKKGESAMYLFADENIFPGEALHYRIQAVLRGGEKETSPVREVHIPNEEWQFEVVGENQSIQTIQIKSNFNDQIQLSIFNADGERLFVRRENLIQGLNQIEIDLSGLPKGVYFINFTSSREKQWVQRIVKL